jgi:GMP synthase (glutamine-hydrolysing)
MRPLLLFRNDEVDTFGIGKQALEGAGLPILALDAWDPGWPDLDEVSGVVAFGGAMNVDETDRFPYLARERTFIRGAVERDVPVLGICLGAQLLARALEAPVRRAPVREIGFRPIRATEQGERDPLVSCFSGGAMVFHWHEDTFDLPADGTLLATGEDVPLQAFRAGERAWGLQFHLEIDREEIDLWLRDAAQDLEERWGTTPAEIRADADEHLAGQTERARAAFGSFAGVVGAREKANA